MWWDLPCPARAGTEAGSPSYRSCSPCRGLHWRNRDPACLWAVPLPEQRSPSCRCQRVPVQGRVCRCQGYHNAVGAWSRQALGDRGWWVPYFCHLLDWLGFSMAGWPAWAWRVLRSTCSRFDLHCFNHPKQASPVNMQILNLCNPFVFHVTVCIFLSLATSVSYENQKQSLRLELVLLLICIYNFISASLSHVLLSPSF